MTGQKKCEIALKDMSYKSRRQLCIIFCVIFFVVAVLGYFFLRQQGDKAVKCKDCNLIMISLSNVSAENMSLYGYERLTTPNLDEWAKDAVVFDNAFTQTSWTLPVATSLFTSLYPYSHKITDTQKTGRFVDIASVLDRNIQTLPEILREEGYKTAAFTGGLDYNNTFGHMRGFEKFWGAANEAPDYETAIAIDSLGPALDKALSWLKENYSKKFFLFIHGYDTHCPIDPPQHLLGTFSSTEGKSIAVDHKICVRAFKHSDNENYEAYYHRGGSEKVILTQDDISYLEDLYDEEILSVDSLVGNFLDALDKPMQENTIIVIFSDHGEMFAKRGRFGRAGRVRGTLYDDAVHIPLIMKVPRQTGKVIEGLAQIIDVMPTLLGILDLPQSKQVQGKSLVPMMNGEKMNVNEYVFAGSKFGAPEGKERSFWLVYPYQSIMESVRSREWKLIHEIIFDKEGEIREDAYELYNLKDDLDELRNVASAHPAITTELKEVLQGWKEAAKSYDVQNVPSPQ